MVSGAACVCGETIMTILSTALTFLCRDRGKSLNVSGYLAIFEQVLNSKQELSQYANVRLGRHKSKQFFQFFLFLLKYMPSRKMLQQALQYGNNILYGPYTLYYENFWTPWDVLGTFVIIWKLLSSSECQLVTMTEHLNETIPSIYSRFIQNVELYVCNQSSR